MYLLLIETGTKMQNPV